MEQHNQRFDVLRKQILIGIAFKFENIDPQELFIRLQAKKVNDKFMTDLNLDDLYGKALGAVKKHWELMSMEEQKAFAQQMKFKHSISFSQHKIGNVDFLPTKQEYELIKEDWADEKLLKYFSGNEIYEDYGIF